ncbi:glycosyltransferase family 4 protein [Belliella aquatica]|uniref:Glycosyl transferase family 1 n=1 Tax=Belliella aquatica TaxID=1323734 RepID=A0ABQ1LXD1_9BACT|nr:glycosyltransferase family 4 protein [Belliella aquatica]MCH7405786.1 glycosyltransferase family 4 protein [Belliella aquatica]GGC30717.1 glycosyl transferase family 1 [Belliella aquatica]
MTEKPKKKVLIITYYWPPSAGSGVQRWLKFAKYLPEFDWEPVIFTPENPDFDLKDESLLHEINPNLEVLKFPIWEPYALFRSLKKEKIKDTSKVLEKKDKSIVDKLGIWARANFLIPDPRIFWVKPSVDFLQGILDNNQIDAIITTGPPHSLHLIGRELKRKTNIFWLADFRDPWSQWEFLDTLPMTSLVRKKHEQMEHTVLREADIVTTISPTFQQDLAKIAGKNISLLTNGFDTADLPVDWNPQNMTTASIEIVYTGVIDAIRNPIPFIEAFQKVFKENHREAHLRFVGKVSSTVEEFVKKDPWLTKFIHFEGYVSHQEVFEYYRKANLLLLILTDTKNAKGNIPGKIFEYLATGRPVLALGDPQGDSAQILKAAATNAVFKHTDQEGIEAFLTQFNPDKSQEIKPDTAMYSRKNLTKTLAKLLDASQDSIS